MELAPDFRIAQRDDSATAGIVADKTALHDTAIAGPAVIGIVFQEKLEDRRKRRQTQGRDQGRDQLLQLKLRRRKAIHSRKTCHRGTCHHE